MFGTLLSLVDPLKQFITRSLSKATRTVHSHDAKTLNRFSYTTAFHLLRHGEQEMLGHPSHTVDPPTEGPGEVGRYQ
jgi:hypothetical protein